MHVMGHNVVNQWDVARLIGRSRGNVLQSYLKVTPKFLTFKPDHKCGLLHFKLKIEKKSGYV